MKKDAQQGSTSSPQVFPPPLFFFFLFLSCSSSSLTRLSILTLLSPALFPSISSSASLSLSPHHDPLTPSLPSFLFDLFYRHLRFCLLLPFSSLSPPPVLSPPLVSLFLFFHFLLLLGCLGIPRLHVVQPNQNIVLHLWAPAKKPRGGGGGGGGGGRVCDTERVPPFREQRRGRALWGCAAELNSESPCREHPCG